MDKLNEKCPRQMMSFLTKPHLNPQVLGSTVLGVPKKFNLITLVKMAMTFDGFFFEKIANKSGLKLKFDVHYLNCRFQNCPFLENTMKNEGFAKSYRNDNVYRFFGTTARIPE